MVPSSVQEQTLRVLLLRVSRVVTQDETSESRHTVLCVFGRLSDPKDGGKKEEREVIPLQDMIDQPKPTEVN